jgi:hypothetical protein
LNFHQARHAFDHHFAHVVFGFSDQSDASSLLGSKRGAAHCLRAHPLGTSTGLARTAAADHQPGQPRFTIRR